MLADEVGLGKTIEAGIVLKEYVLRGMVKTALILAPPSLVSQWQEELAAKFDLHLPSTDDPQWRKDPAGLWDQPMIVASINQAKSKRHMDRVAQRPFDIVIVDEAHHLKNPKTLNWQLVNNLHKRFLLLLTATPVENNLMELYSLVTLLKPGQLSTASAFRQQFMTRGDPTSPQNRDKLKELLGQVMIRNTRALAKLDIPPRFAQTLRVTPAPAENAIYAQLTQVVKTLAQAQRHTDRLVIKTLLEQVGSSPAALVATLDRLSKREDLDPAVRGQIEAIGRLQRSMGDTGKDRQLIEILQAADGKMLIFAKFRATVDHLARLLEWHRIDHALFHGGMDGPEKDRQVERFREDKPVLIATEVGGEGRNLQFCHQMINFDLPWNPMRIEQRIGRLHRIGQNRPVQIYNLVSAGSVEDFILEVLDRKINMFEMVIGEIEMILGRVEGDQEFADLVLDIWLTAASESERRQRFDQLGKYLIKLKKEYEKTRVLDEKLFGDQYEL
jgi:SNF2 family DNA or RNA helicase